MQFLNIKIDSLSLTEAKEKVLNFLNSISQYKIFTPNPEMIVKAHADQYFKKVLNSGDLNICDGFGLSLFSGAKRITGVDFMLEVCQMAEQTGRTVYLLGSGNQTVVQNTVKKILEKFPKLKIVGADPGENMTEETGRGGGMAEKVAESEAEILFVAFGMGKQEKWIYENLTKMPKIKIAMGVGGAFDYISGFVPRAPLFLRKIGLEWMYRLIRQPRRFCRILRATFSFTFLAIKNYEKKI